MESLRNRAGQTRPQFMPGNIPSQPQQGMPTAPQTSQPPPQGGAMQPQAGMMQAQPRVNANHLVYTPPNQIIPNKQSQTFQTKSFDTSASPGDRYEIGVFSDP